MPTDHRLAALHRQLKRAGGRFSSFATWLCAWVVVCAGLAVRASASTATAGTPGTPTPLPFQEVFVGLAPDQGARIPGVGFTAEVDVTIRGMYSPLSGTIGFTYDPTIVLATGTLPGTLTGCSVQTSLGGGMVTVSFDCPAGASVVGAVSGIIFQGVSPGTSALSFSNSAIPDGCVLHSGAAECLGDPQGDLPRDGSITVGGGTPAAPSLTAVIDVSPATVAAGKTFTLTVTATNAGMVTLTNVGPVGAVQTTSNDGGEVQLVSGPVPEQVATLPRGQQAQFAYQFKATVSGNVTLTVPLGGTDPGGKPVAGQAVCTLPAATGAGRIAASGCNDSVQIKPACTAELLDVSPPIVVTHKTGRILDIDTKQPIACGQGGTCPLRTNLSDKIVEVELVPLTAEAQQSTKNVGQEVKLGGGLTLNNDALTLESTSLQWTVEGETIEWYTDVAGYVDGVTQALHFTHAPVLDEWAPSTKPTDESNGAIRFFWKDTGTFAVNLTATAKDPDGIEYTCEDKKTFTVERNQTDPDRQPEDFFTSCCDDAPERVRLTHLKWHDRNDAGDPHPGDDWLNFHRALTSVFNDWRDFFGYPPVGTYDGSTQFPDSENGYTLQDASRGTDTPRCPVPTDLRDGPQPLRANCPLPAWFTPVSDGTARPPGRIEIQPDDLSDPTKGYILQPHCYKAQDYNHDRCWPVGFFDTTPPLTSVTCGTPPGLSGPLIMSTQTFAIGPATATRDVASVGQRTLADFLDNVELGCVVTKSWHLDMHILINGAMALTNTSPKDPVFYRMHQLLSGVSVSTAGRGTPRTRALDAAASETLYEQWEDHMAAGPPGLTMRFPYPGYPLAALTGVAVAFWEPVTGVQPGDLLVNGAPAMMVEGSGKGPYIFTGFPMIPAPPSGATTAVTVQLLPGNTRDADNHGFAGDTWAYTLEPDRDGDGVPDSIDNCPDVPNPLQENSSRYIVHGGDPTGHCTCGAIFPGHPEGDACSDDWDGDGFSNELEIQLGSDPKSNASIPNPTQLPPGTCSTCAEGDFDGDGVPNGSDGCYTDPNKTAPGICGCNAPDVDSDGDRTYDCADGCPHDPAKTDPGDCGCGFADLGRDAGGQPICAALTASGTPTPSTVAMTPTPVPAPTVGATVPASCVGDCNRTGMVTISDLITGVLIALDEAPLSACTSLDVNRDGRVTVDELVKAVQAALDGCSS